MFIQTVKTKAAKAISSVFLTILSDLAILPGLMFVFFCLHNIQIQNLPASKEMNFWPCLGVTLFISGEVGDYEMNVTILHHFFLHIFSVRTIKSK
jgi:hypothetical protein